MDRGVVFNLTRLMHVPVTFKYDQRVSKFLLPDLILIIIILGVVFASVTNAAAKNRQQSSGVGKHMVQFWGH